MIGIRFSVPIFTPIWFLSYLSYFRTESVLSAICGTTESCKSTTPSYHGRQKGSKWVGNGTTSALKRINEVTDKTEKSLQSRSRRFSVAPMMEKSD